MKDPHPSPPSRTFVLGALAVAVLGIGVAAPLIRLTSASAPAVAFWRMAFSTAITGSLWAAAGGHGPSRRYGKKEWLLALLAGLCLAIHFASWIQSLSTTTVAASVVLVNTQPAFVALLATLFLREPASPPQWAGIAVAMAGACLVALDGHGTGLGSPLVGNLLALVGAVSAAAYYVVGRALRRTTGIWAYVTRVYGISAVLLLALAAAAGTRLAPFPARDWLIFLGLALGPSLLGHTILNWSLRWLPAAAVNVVALGEPIVAAGLAAAIPAIGEVPGWRTAAGGCVTLLGIAVVLMNPRRAEGPAGPRSADPEPAQDV